MKLSMPAIAEEYYLTRPTLCSKRPLSNWQHRKGLPYNIII